MLCYLTIVDFTDFKVILKFFFLALLLMKIQSERLTKIMKNVYRL